MGEREVTILITSHILESLTSICDTISHLREGKIIATIPKTDFANIEDKFFGTFNQENERLVNKLL